MSEKKKREPKEILAQMIDKDVPALMEQIMLDAKAEASIKAARVGLANTALHHLRLLKAAYE